MKYSSKFRLIYGSRRDNQSLDMVNDERNSVFRGSITKILAISRLMTYCIPWKGHQKTFPQWGRDCMPGTPDENLHGDHEVKETKVLRCSRPYWGWIRRCHAWCWCFLRKRRTESFWDNVQLIFLELVVTLDECCYSEQQDWFCSMARTLGPFHRSSWWNGSYFGYGRSEFRIRYSYWSTASRLEQWRLNCFPEQYGACSSSSYICGRSSNTHEELKISFESSSYISGDWPEKSTETQ